MGRKRLTASTGRSELRVPHRTPPFEWLFYQPHCTTTLLTLIPLKYCHAYSYRDHMHSTAILPNLRYSLIPHTHD